MRIIKLMMLNIIDMFYNSLHTKQKNLNTNDYSD